MYSFLGNAVAKTTGSVWRAFTLVEKIVLTICSILCGFIFLWTGDLLGIPREPGYSGSLLASGSAVSSLIVVLIAIAICSAVAGLVALIIDVQSGVFCCCIGLVALSIRSGGIRPVLQYASGPSVFVAMAVELALLAAAIFGVWFALSRIFTQPGSITSLAAPNETTDANLAQKLMTTGVQVVVMGVCELILIQTDAPSQAVAAVAIAAFLGTLASYMFTPLPEGIWYWVGPAVLGVIGYLLASISGDSTSMGDVHGWAAALARATPLDYASAGISGAMLGYWCSRRWAQPEESESETAA